MTSRALAAVLFATLAGCQWIVGIGERSAGAGDAGPGGTAAAGGTVPAVGGASGSSGQCTGGCGNAGATGGGNGGRGGTSGGAGPSGASGGTSGTCADTGSEAGAAGAVPDDAGEPVREQTFVDVRFEGAACMRTGASGVSCSAMATATRGDVEIVFPTWSGGIVCGGDTVYAYDDRGNRYLTSGVRFASETHTDRCGLPVTLIDGVSAELRYDFTEVSDGATEIALLQFRPQIDDVLEDAEFRRLPVSDCGGEGWTADGEAMLGRALGSLTTQDVSITYYPCRTQGNDEFACPLVLSSPSNDRALAFPTRSGGITCGGGTTSAFDDQGNELTMTRLDVANQTVAPPCDFSRLLVRAAPTLVRYHFGPVESNVETITQIRLASLVVDGAAQEVRIPALPLER